VLARRWPARFGETAQRVRAANAMFRELHHIHTITTLTRRRAGVPGSRDLHVGTDRRRPPNTSGQRRASSGRPGS